MSKEDLIPIKPGQVLNKYGRGGKPENREAIEERRMKKKILKEMLIKELEKEIGDTGITTGQYLIQQIIRNAPKDARLAKIIFDSVDGPQISKIDMDVETNQAPSVLLYIPKKEEEE